MNPKIEEIVETTQRMPFIKGLLPKDYKEYIIPEENNERIISVVFDRNYNTSAVYLKQDGKVYARIFSDFDATLYENSHLKSWCEFMTEKFGEPYVTALKEHNKNNCNQTPLTIHERLRTLYDTNDSLKGKKTEVSMSSGK